MCVCVCVISGIQYQNKGKATLKNTSEKKKKHSHQLLLGAHDVVNPTRQARPLSPPAVLFKLT